MSDDAASLIDKLGGYAKVAAGLNVPAGTVAAWRHRKSIPVGYWSALVTLAAATPADEVTFETLASAHAARPASDGARV